MLKRIKYRGNEAYFYKLYTTIAFSITLIILVLTAFLYFNFKSYSLDLLHRSDQRQIQKSFENALQLHAYLKTYSTALYNHPDTLQLMSGNTASVLDTLNSLRSLDTTVNSAPYLYSVYVYNGSSDTFYMTGPNAITRSSADFYDTEITSLLRNRQSALIGQPLPRSIPVSSENDGQMQVFTYVLADYRQGSDMPIQALIVNVRIEWLFNTLASYGDKERLEGQSLLVLDPGGRAIAHSDRSLFLTDLYNEGYIQVILNSNDSTGYSLVEVNGHPSAVTYSSNPNSSWTMVSITPYAYIAGTVNKVKTLTLLIGFSMFIACLIMTFVLSRSLYSPVRRLREKVSEWSTKTDALTHEDEFSFISRTLTTTQDQLSSLASFKSSNIHTLKQNLLKNIIDRTIPNRYESLFHDYSIPLDAHGSIALILLKIDRYSDFTGTFSDHDQALIKYALMNITEEIINSSLAGACVDLGGDHIVLLFNIEEAESELLKRISEDIQRSALRFCSLSVSLFISEVASSIRESGLLYEEMLALSRYRIFLGHGCITLAGEFKEEAIEENPVDNHLLVKLMETIRKGNLDEMQSAYDEIAALLNSTTYNALMYSLSSMTALIFQTLSLLEKNSTVSFELDFIEFDHRIKSLETLQQIHSAFEALFQEIANRLNQNKGERSLHFVRSAERYIRQNYTDKALSTKLIASQVELSTAYLGKLFREHHNKSISEYLSEVRLEQAGALLRETSHTVDEIVNHIGWENKKYFFTIFKKHYGSTPTEYRLKSKLDRMEY